MIENINKRLGGKIEKESNSEGGRLMEGVSVEAIQEGGRLSKEGVEWSEGSQTFASRQDLVARGGDDMSTGRDSLGRN